MNRIDITKYLETLYPRHLAYDWDNVGLQVGSLNKPAKRVMTTLDVTKAVVQEAILSKADLVITHHPLIFQPINSIPFDTPRGWAIAKLIKHDIALYAMHTNFDRAENGMNDQLAALLGLRNVGLLDEEVEIGRFGDIDPLPLEAFIAFVKDRLELSTLRLIGGANRTVTRVGISAGSGAQHMHQAKRRGCDVYLTGDVTYHHALDCEQMGFAILDVGHHVEAWFKRFLSSTLKERFPELEILVSTAATDPYALY